MGGSGTGERTARSFTMDLPDGFVELPGDIDAITGDQVRDVGAHIARQLTLPEGDENCLAAAVYLSAVGTSSNANGIDHTALAMFRSPDDPDRAMMVMLNSSCLPCAHDGVDTAIAGLTEVHAATGRGAVSTLELAAGPAVCVVEEERNGITIGEATAPISHRKVTAWIPDPTGSTIAMVSVSSNNWQEWHHICRLALALFNTITWQA